MSIAADAIAAYLADNRDRLATFNDDALAGELELLTCAPVNSRADLVQAGAIIVILLERNGA